MSPFPSDPAALAEGGKAALARCLSAIEAWPEDPAIAPLLDAAWRAPRGVALGLTGPPGVGKSTLTGALLGALRQRGERVGVIAVDPSSRVSGGALLGDRTRIGTDPGDAGAFVRSVASGGRLGGLADAVFPTVVLMRSLFDWVLVETVGVGQSETEIADCADLVAFCVQPGAGDAVQFMKAGVIEVPDLFLVTKGDLGPAAERAAAEARAALALAVRRAPPVEVVSARTGAGLAEALALLDEGRAALGDPAGRRLGQARAWVRRRVLESFGRVGEAALGSRYEAGAAPFGVLATLSERAGAAVHEAIKNI